MPTTPLLNMFAQSPVRPLQKHMAQAVLAAEFFIETAKEDWDKAKRIQVAICDAEHGGDRLKRELRIHMPKGLFMSMPRSDILAILKVQEKVANLSKDIVGIVLGRRLVIPSELSEDFLVFVGRAVDAVKQAHKGISKVGGLMPIGFKGKEVERIQELIHVLDAIETETDKQQIDLRHRLFALEDTMAPIDVMFLYQIIEQVGELADRAQEVGERLILLLAK
jgi:predicted phosphate transport protein (TIGR00153 family)